jgi:hypothetical protein
MSNDQQFVWPTSFACTIITEKIILPNLYSITIGIEPIASGQNNIALGFKKLRHFIDRKAHGGHSYFMS